MSSNSQSEKYFHLLRNRRTNAEFRENRRLSVLRQRQKSKANELLQYRGLSESDTGLTSTRASNYLNDFNFKIMFERLCSAPNQEHQLAVVKAINKLLSTDLYQNVPIDCITQGIVNTLVDCLRQRVNVILQLEAIALLTRITSITTNHFTHMVDAGAVKIFIELLSSPVVAIVRQAIHVLVRIFSSDRNALNVAHDFDIVQRLLCLINCDSAIDLVQKVSRVIRLLCSDYAAATATNTIMQQIMQAINMLMDFNNFSILWNSLNALQNLSGQCKNIKLIFESGVVAKLVASLRHTNIFIKGLSLTTLKNLIAGQEQIQQIIFSGVLLQITELLSHQNTYIREKAFNLLANLLLNGNPKQVQLILNADMLKKICQNMCKRSFSSKKNAAMFVRALTIVGNESQISEAIEAGMLSLLCDLLGYPDQDGTEMVLDALNNMLHRSADFLKIFDAHFKAFNGMRKICGLQHHDDATIKQKVDAIIQLYMAFNANNKRISELSADVEMMVNKEPMDLLEE